MAFHRVRVIIFTLLLLKATAVFAGDLPNLEPIKAGLRSSVPKNQIAAANSLSDLAETHPHLWKEVSEKEFSSFLPFMAQVGPSARSALRKALSMLLPTPPLAHSWNPQVRQKFVELAAQDMVIPHRQELLGARKLKLAIKEYSKDYKNQNEVIRYCQNDAQNRLPALPESLVQTVKDQLLFDLGEGLSRGNVQSARAALVVAKRLFHGDSEIAQAVINIVSSKYAKKDLIEFQSSARIHLEAMTSKDPQIINQIAKIPNIPDVFGNKEKALIFARSGVVTLLATQTVLAALDQIDFSPSEFGTGDPEAVIRFLKKSAPHNAYGDRQITAALYRDGFYDLIRSEWPEFLKIRNLYVDPELALKARGPAVFANWIDGDSVRLMAFFEDLLDLTDSMEEDSLEPEQKKRISKAIEPLILNILRSPEKYSKSYDWVGAVSQLIERFPQLNASMRKFAATEEGKAVLSKYGNRFQKLLNETCGLDAEVKRKSHLRVVQDDES